MTRWTKPRSVLSLLLTVFLVGTLVTTWLLESVTPSLAHTMYSPSDQQVPFTGNDNRGQTPTDGNDRRPAARTHGRRGPQALPEIRTRPLGAPRDFPNPNQHRGPDRGRNGAMDEREPAQDWAVDGSSLAAEEPEPTAGTPRWTLLASEMFPARYSLVVPAMPMPAQVSCPTPTLNLKVLIISADGSETTLPAIKQVLDYQGTPYDTWVTNQLHATGWQLTADKLASGCVGSYQGVILATGALSYTPDGGNTWLSGLSPAEWQVLWDYQRDFGVREVSWYTFPTADYGYAATVTGTDTTSSPINATLTTAGRPIFSYVNANNALAIRNAWTYQAKPLDSSTTPLLSDAQGNALGAIRTYTDGRQVLSLTFDSNQFLTHNLVLSYGLVNWVTKGLFLGARRVYVGAQIDDVFIDDDIWRPNTPCGTPTDQTGATYRITGTDWQRVVSWQQAKRNQATTRALRLDMAFNGSGTTGIYNPDTLSLAAGNTQAQFKWINHTWTHENLDAVSYNTARDEIVQNNQRAAAVTNYSILNLVTPDISGLTNQAAMQAAYDTGVRYVVSDTSRPEGDNPAPNLGRYNKLVPGILEIPRRPNNLFYNVSRPAEWVAEYNCIYRSFWGRDLTYQEILDKESDVLLAYLLKGEMDPWMFHQPNLRAYDGTRLLLGDLLDAVFQKYNRLFTLPIVSPTMDDLGSRMAKRMAYKDANVTASVTGQSITLRAQQAATVEVTGLRATGAESYGGQNISAVSVNAGQTVTLPLQ